jgi:hypothetical protein
MTEERASMLEDAPDDDEPYMDPAAKTQPAEGGRDEAADPPDLTTTDASDVSESGRRSPR